MLATARLTSAACRCLPPPPRAAADDANALPREALLQLLQLQGEPLSEDELHVALAALLAGGGAGEPLQALPEALGAREFCAGVLGLAEAEAAAAGGEELGGC